ncbi:MAG: hypothetical protein IJJ14_00070 [Coriobacteriales bacterium]|nr:hypothetical protein [Coriobacteriales bacterium]
MTDSTKNSSWKIALPLCLVLTLPLAACAGGTGDATPDVASNTTVASAPAADTTASEPAASDITPSPATTPTPVLTGETYTATNTDQSAVDVGGTQNLTRSGALIQKTAGDASSADAASFKGVNSAVRVYDNATLSMDNCVIESSAKDATGVFAYDGGVIKMSDCVVTVSGGGAGGVQVAGGGTLLGSNLQVSSASKAAIRSDRGGGTIELDGGTYTSTGSNGCPAIYSTADITVSNATCTSTNSRAVIIEGMNSVTLNDCVLSGNDQSSKSGSVHANVLLYQSASGDAKEGTSEFTMTGGSMTCASGAMFYCTNTSSVVKLQGVTLMNDASDDLLIVGAGRWGKDGRNGGNCQFIASQQVLEGAISVDAISKLTLSLTDGSSFTGSIGGDGQVSVSLDANSSWTLTADSYVSALSGDTSGISLNGHKLYVDGVAWTN